MWLQNINRLNVASTRARRALVMIGHGDTLRHPRGVPAAAAYYDNLFQLVGSGDSETLRTNSRCDGPMTRFRRAGTAPDCGTLRATRVLLPVLWWRDVSLTVAEPVELSPLDMFFVEAVTLRGRLDAEEFRTYTGLPARVFGGLARRLWNLDLVGLSAGVATPVRDGHRRATEGTAAKMRTITKDLLFLPHTDDLVVVDGGLGYFERTLPHQVDDQAPLPERLAGLTRDAFLSDRFSAGTVVNMPPQVQGVATNPGGDEPLHAMAGAEGRSPVPLVPAIDCAWHEAHPVTRRRCADAPGAWAITGSSTRCARTRTSPMPDHALPARIDLGAIACDTGFFLPRNAAQSPFEAAPSPGPWRFCSTFRGSPTTLRDQRPREVERLAH